MKLNYIHLMHLLGYKKEHAKKAIHRAIFGTFDDFIEKEIKYNHYVKVEDFSFLEHRIMTKVTGLNAVEYAISNIRIHGLSDFRMNEIYNYEKCKFKMKLCGDYDIYNKVLSKRQIENICEKLKRRLQEYIGSGNVVPEKYRKFSQGLQPIVIQKEITFEV